MSHPVTYYCPHCGAFVELQRDGYLADKSVTPYPLVGWQYAEVDEDYEADGVDGVHLVCGESAAPTIAWLDGRSDADDVQRPASESPCGRDFYLSFVRYEDGEEVDPVPESQYVRLG
ncbi:MAG: hypothetical protein ACQETI_13295 [Halobacteriota archaeon]